MKKVYMGAILRTTEIEIKDKDDVAAIDFGGYNFKINDQDIPFDFKGYGVNIKEDSNGKYLELDTSIKSFLNVFDIDFELFKEEYDSLGLKNEDITAKFLASASKINEFYFLLEDKNGNEYADGVIEDIWFADENGAEYHMDKSLFKQTLNEINNNLNKENI